MKILFIRHGQTETNVRGVLHAMNDTSHLSEVGKNQAQN